MSTGGQGFHDPDGDTGALAESLGRAILNGIPDAGACGRDRDDAARGLPLSGSSRKLGREWRRIIPGTEGQLISFGGVNDTAYAWIDVREERRPAREAAGQLTLAGEAGRGE